MSGSDPMINLKGICMLTVFTWPQSLLLQVKSSQFSFFSLTHHGFIREHCMELIMQKKGRKILKMTNKLTLQIATISIFKKKCMSDNSRKITHQVTSENSPLFTFHGQPLLPEVITINWFLVYLFRMIFKCLQRVKSKLVPNL